MSKAYQKYTLEVFDAQDVAVATGILGFVFTAGSNTLATIVGDLQGTTKANPVTVAQYATDGGRIEFWGTPGGTYDVLVVHTDGRQARVDGLSATGIKYVTLASGPNRHRIIPFTNTNTVETDTTIDLKKDEVVQDVLIEVVTNVAGSSIEVGLLSSESGGDADGFADIVLTSALGFIRPIGVGTPGANIDSIAAVTRGVLLASFLNGTDAVAVNGYYIEKPHRCDGTAKSITYTTTAHSVAGYIHIMSVVGKG